MTISERLYRLIKGKKITQKTLSEAAGVSKSTVTVWFKTNTDTIPSSSIIPICKLLGITPSELLTGENQEQGQIAKEEPSIKLADDEEKLIAIYRQLDWQAKQMVTASAIGELRRSQIYTGEINTSEPGEGKVG